jgi:hypothetical protein
MPDIGTGITAAASIGGSLIGSSASKSAAKTQANAATNASAAEQQMFQQNREDLAPWRASGGRSLTRLEELLGAGDGKMSRAEFTSRYNQPIGRDWLPAELTNINNAYAAYMNQPTQRSPEFGSLLKDFTPADFQADPSYEFRRSEGQRGIERNASARGMQLSGATLRALNRYNSDLASQEYGNAYSRDAANKERKYNMLAGVAGTGQAATNTSAALGANSAANQASLLTGAANAQAAGTIGSANALAGGFSDALGAYQQAQLLNRLLPRGSTSSGGGGFTNPSAFSMNSLRLS